MSTIKSSAENLTLNADGANNDVIIQSNGSTKVTVDGATGNVGVGQTTPASNNSSPRVLHIGSSGDSKASIVLEENGSTGSNTWEILSDDELQIRRGSSQKMYFKTDGLAVFNNGVALGGTGAANTLNDYEIGTFTPGITASSAITVTVSTCTYTKIGRLVYVNGLLRRNDSGTYNANITFTNLPFSVGSTDSVSGNWWTDSGSDDGHKGSFLVPASGSTAVALHGSTPATTSRYVAADGTNAAFPNNEYFFFSITYITA